MSDDSLDDGFDLGYRSGQGGEEVVGEKGAGEFEGEERRLLVLGDCADVVEEAGEGVGGGGDGPGGELGCEDCAA